MNYNNYINDQYLNNIKLVNENLDYLKNKVILDIGSNMGVFAKCIADTVPYSQIHLFEPVKEYLNESKKLLNDYSNLTFNNYALGDTNSELVLYKSSDNFGHNTLYKKDPLQDELFFERMSTEVINVVKLDDYYNNIGQIDFIKIDVEGFERNVLEGSWKLIEKFKPYILIEVSWGRNHPDWELNKKIYEKLFSLGYEKNDLNTLENTKDILFKPINKLPISIGILSWNSNNTLRNTLKSYKNNGLFEIVNDVTIFFQECSDDDLKLSKEYDIPFIAYNKNIGIGEAFFKLAQVSETDNILLLENDWELIEDRQTTYDRLKSGINLLNSDFNCVRYRHRKIPGHPLHSKNVYMNNELDHYDDIAKLKSPHLIECIHWIENPEQLFPDKIVKNDEYYITSSRWSCFTNNPCLYKKSFYMDIVNSFKNKGYELENDISYWWVRQNFKVAFGEGLFSHNDIEKYKTLNWKPKMNNELQQLLYNYIQNPSDSENNFQLALYYHNIGQTASAVSYYLRAAERAENSILAYECLLRASICFDTQGTRGFTVKGLLQHAISLFPKRPEAYYMLSKYHEKENHPGAWKECYMIASIGHEVADLNPQQLRTYVGYPPHYGLLFQKAVSSWWCGLCEESKDLFKKLLTEYSLDENHRNSVLSNLKFLKVIS